jgi:ADP-heptose:LPS heptosyltransferase
MAPVSSPEAPAALNPDQMRRIDRWVGIPICFALTVLARLRAALSGDPTPEPQPPQNVLFIELAEMGSTVLACPAIHRLKRAYPNARVFFLLFKHIEESMKVLKVIPEAHVMTIDVSSPWTIARDTLRFMRAARRERIDAVINLEMFARFSTILTYLSGARTRVGFHRFTQEGLYAGDLFTHKVIYNPHLHTWQSLTTLVEALAAPRAELPLGKFPAPPAAECVVPRIGSDPPSRQRMVERLERHSPAMRGKRLIAINPNASKLIAIRKWPIDRYAELVGQLLQDPRNACVITGLASDSEDARVIVQRVNSDRLVDLTGQTSLAELIDLYNIADLLVTNDSGPAHFAALTPIEVVVFFGPETPLLYRPLTERCTVLYSHYACSPCVSAYNQRRSVCTNNRCLTHIDVATAHAAITAVLERRSQVLAEPPGGRLDD